MEKYMHKILNTPQNLEDRIFFLDNEHADELRKREKNQAELFVSSPFEAIEKHIHFITCPTCNTAIQLSFISDRQCRFCFSNIPGELFR